MGAPDYTKEKGHIGSDSIWMKGKGGYRIIHEPELADAKGYTALAVLLP